MPQVLPELAGEIETERRRVRDRNGLVQQWRAFESEGHCRANARLPAERPAAGAGRGHAGDVAREQGAQPRGARGGVGVHRPQVCDETVARGEGGAQRRHDGL